MSGEEYRVLKRVFVALGAAVVLAVTGYTYAVMSFGGAW